MCIWEKFPRPGARLYPQAGRKNAKRPLPARMRGRAFGYGMAGRPRFSGQKNKPLRSIGIRNG